MLLFWCNSCSKQVKLGTRGWKEEDIRSKHNCPTCGSIIVGWYAEPDKDRYLKFALGLVLMTGGLITSTIEGQFGSYGYIPAMIIFPLSIIEMIVGMILMYTTMMRMKVSHPPAHATESINPLPNNVFFREMIILVIIGLIGGAILWGINALILDIVMGFI